MSKKSKRPSSFLKNMQKKPDMQAQIEAIMRRRDSVNIPLATMLGADTAFEILYNDFVIPYKEATEEQKEEMITSLFNRIEAEHDRIHANRSLTQAELDEKQSAMEKLHADLQAQKQREIEEAVKADKGQNK